MTPQVAYSYLPYAVNYGYHNFPTVAAAPQSVPVAVAQAAPVAVAHAAPVAVTHTAPVAVAHAAPVAVANAAPVAVANAAVPIVAAPSGEVNSQFHAQDESGSYSYGYNSATQAKSEVKSADGVTRGSYSYVDPNGLLQTVNYISDAMGFRVAATNLPVHHVEDNAVEAVANTNTVIS